MKIPANATEIFFKLAMAGRSPASIAKQYKICSGYVSILVRQHPDWVAHGPHAWTEERRTTAARLYLSGLTLEKVAERLKTSRRRLALIFKEDKIKIRREYLSGPESPQWRGGKTLRKGYIYLKRPDHPLCDRHGYVAEHRLAMEKKLKRFLLSSEVVHHKNKDRTDNRIANLELFESNGKHLSVELAGQCPKWSKEGRKRIHDALQVRKAKARAKRS